MKSIEVLKAFLIFLITVAAKSALTLGFPIPSLDVSVLEGET